MMLSPDHTNSVEYCIEKGFEITFNSLNTELAGRLYEAQPKTNSAVIICHGAYDSQSDWQPFANRLYAEGFTTLTFDFVGHGQSKGTRSLIDLRIWAYNIRDAMNFLQSRGYRSFALVGWNFGGSAALLAAVHDPRISCLVTLAAPIFVIPPFGERVAYGLASTFAKARKLFWKKPFTLSRLNELDSMRFLLDEEANMQYINDPIRRERYQAVPIPDSLDSVWFDISHTVGKVKAPVLIIHGKQDEIVPAEQSFKLNNLLHPPKDLHVLPESGHALHLDDQKDDVFRLILKWIKHYLRPNQPEKRGSQ